MFGYCVAPLNIAALVSTFVHLIYVRAPIALAAWAWCVWGMAYVSPSKLLILILLSSRRQLLRRY